MPTMYVDPKGEAYKALIDFAIAHAAMFVLADRDSLMKSKRCYDLFQQLEPYLIAKRSFEELSGHNEIAYSEGKYYLYTCSQEAGRILKEATVSLFSWMHPHLPEDLCFLDAEGKDFLITIAHEEIGQILINEEEASTLADNIPGLFLRLASHADFNHFLDDAIKHQTDKLTISSFGLTEIPERIRKLQNLTYLHIFEQEIRALSPALFEIPTLETLEILTTNLEAIPKEIARLTRLKKLTICCGSYDRPTAETQLIAKADVTLKCLPPEIGELQQLEHLEIRYTALKELPRELEKLKHLHTLDVSDNLLEAEPLFLSRMPNLKQVLVYGNPFCVD